MFTTVLAMLAAGCYAGPHEAGPTVIRHGVAPGRATNSDCNVFSSVGMAAKEEHMVDSPKEPHPKLKELIERLAGKWKVSGPGVDGEAEYRAMKGGFSLVQHVDFVHDGARIKIIQHIAYDQDTDTLRAHYMDTMGDESTYTWTLDGQKIRVSLDGEDSDTFFEAVLNDDDSVYVGTWHYPNSNDNAAAAERIEYRRMG